MSDKTIGLDSRITLHFSLLLEDGYVIDSTFDKQPASFQYGDGNLLPGFEQKLLGLRAGHKARFTVTPEQGFGSYNPANIQRFSTNDFAGDMELSEGLMISFSDASRAQLTGVVKSIQGDVVEVDFNHPLAGRNIIFDIEVIDVATAEQ